MGTLWSQRSDYQAKSMHQVVNGRSPLADGHDVCNPDVSEYLSDAAVQLWKLPVVHRCIEHLNQLWWMMSASPEASPCAYKYGRITASVNRGDEHREAVSVRAPSKTLWYESSSRSSVSGEMAEKSRSHRCRHARSRSSLEVKYRYTVLGAIPAAVATERIWQSTSPRVASVVAADTGESPVGYTRRCRRPNTANLLPSRGRCRCVAQL